MIKKNQFFGLIPARSGSKGLKNKNLLKIKSRTLVEIAIDNVLSSKFIKRIYLTSDSEKILKYGAKKKISNILRPKKYSSDKSTSKDVIGHFLKYLNLAKYTNNYIVYIQPSSPLFRSEHIDKAINLIKKKKSNTLISCYLADSEKILKSISIKKNGKVKPIFKKSLLYTNRQSFKKIYIPNGAIFIFKITKKFIKKYIDYSDCTPYVMRRNDVVDINNKEDFFKAKKLF